MPEQQHPLVDRIANDLAAVNWPSPEEIRSRARRRTILTSVAAPIAVALLLVGSWAALAGRPHDQLRPAPAASGTVSSVPSTSPSPLPTFVVPGDPAWIGPEAMLQPADVGPGMRLHNEDSFEPRENVSLTFDVDSNCARYHGLGVHREYQYMRVHDIEREAEYNGVDAVRVEIARYSDKLARQVMADIRQVVDTCATSTFDSTEASTPSHPALAIHYWALLDSGFVGDDSLLLRHEVYTRDKLTGEKLGEDTVTVFAIVRLADLITIVQSDNLTPERMRQLGRSAATRLCRAASPPC
jgi:hypothetical protein